MAVAESVRQKAREKAREPVPQSTDNTKQTAGDAKTAAEAADFEQPAVVVDPTRAPTVIVNDLYVTYRVYGAGGKGTAASALARVVRGRRRPTMKEIRAIRGMSFVAYHG